MIVCTKCLREFGNKGAFTRHKNVCNCDREDKQNIRKLYDSGLSSREIRKSGYGLRVVKDSLRGYRRSHSEAGKLAHKRHPNSFKHTDESKKKMSEARKKWLEKNKHKYNWRYKEETYPEKIFREWCETLDVKIIAEFTPDNFDRYYRIDFAVIDKMIAIEINGEQHYDRQGNLREYYSERHQYLESKGWVVFDILARDIIKNFDDVKEQVINCLKCRQSKQINHIVRHKVLRDKIKQEKSKQKTEKLKAVKLALENDRRNIINEVLQSYGNKHGVIGKIAKRLGVTSMHVRRIIRKLEIDVFERTYV